MKIAVYPGTFDPITLGHLDIIRRGAHLVDKLAKTPEEMRRVNEKFGVAPGSNAPGTSYILGHAWAEANLVLNPLSIYALHTAPITYSINGEQYVAVFAGGNSVPYASQPGDNLWAFKLGGTVPPAATPPAPAPARKTSPTC